MRKKLIGLLAAAVLAITMTCCARSVSDTAENTEEVPATESQADTEDNADKLAEYAGVWYLDGEATGEHLSSYDSVEELFGSSLLTTGAEMTITEDGSISYYIGDDIYAEGTCRVEEGWILANLELNRDNQADQADPDEEESTETGADDEDNTETMIQILQPTILSEETCIAMVLDEETIYWTMDQTKSVSASESETSAETTGEKEELTDEEMEALSDVTWEVVNGYNFENDCSELSFLLDGTTLRDCGDYYMICATLEKPVVVSGSLKIGETLTFTINDLTGEEETVVYESEGILVNEETGMEYYYWPDNDEVTLYSDSDDRVDSPFYEGALRIRKDALTGAEITEDYETVTTEILEQESCWFNAVSFDEDGYVTGLMFSGD